MGQGWRGGYLTTFFVQLGLSIIMFLALTLWKKVKFNEEQNTVSNADDIRQKTEKITIKSVLKNPLVYVVLLIFAGSCSVEFTFGTWGSTFFVEARGMSADMGALAVTFYYAGMAFGRFTAGLLSSKFKPWQLIISGQIITFIAILVMFFPVHDYALITCMFFVAFGNGPVFPNMARPIQPC